MNTQKHGDTGREGPARDLEGNMLPNSYFPDMKDLTAYSQVIAIDQDPLGKCAAVKKTEDTFQMVNELEDGSQAIGLCNKGKSAAEITLDMSETGIGKNTLMIRDVWRQKHLGVFKQKYTTIVPARGVVLVMVSDPFKKH